MMTSQSFTCPFCGADQRERSRFCGSCGKSLAPEAFWPDSRPMQPLSFGNNAVRETALPMMSDQDATLAADSDGRFEPLRIEPEPIGSGRPSLRRAARLAVIAGLIVSGSAWIVAEWKLATLDTWGKWDTVWFIAAGVTSILAICIAIDFWRHARSGPGGKAAVGSYFR